MILNELNIINYGSTKKPQSASKQPTGKNFTSVEDVPKGLFNYGGSTSWASIRLVVLQLNHHTQSFGCAMYNPVMPFLVLALVSSR